MLCHQVLESKVNNVGSEWDIYNYIDFFSSGNWSVILIDYGLMGFFYWTMKVQVCSVLEENQEGKFLWFSFYAIVGFCLY